MASPSDSAAIINIYNTVFISNCCGIGSAVFFIYDCIITSTQTINIFWTKKPTGATILFLSNRYLTLLTSVLGFIGFARLSDKTCETWTLGISAVSFCRYIPWAAFSALRVLALSRSWVILTIVFLLSLAPSVINYVRYRFGLTGVNDPLVGCTTSINMPIELAKQLTILSRTCLIASDAIVIVVTWYTMPRRESQYMGAGQNRSTLSGILLRDGTIYFIVLFILNSLHLTLTMVSIVTSYEQASYMTLFTDPVTAVIVSRFLLDLQSTNRKMIGLSDGDENMLSSDFSLQSHRDSLMFTRIVGSIASPIIHEERDTVDEEEEMETAHVSSSDRRSGHEKGKEVCNEVVGT